jgi:hypothetical protein
MTTRIYGFTALTGGGTGALDKYPEAGMPALATDDYAFGHVAGVFYIYWFNGASAEAESPPAIIAPDSGSGRWILKGFSFAHNDLASIDGGNVSPEEYYHLSSADYNTINTALAQSILANPTGGAAPITNLTVAEQTLVGRITGGNVDALSVVQVKALLAIVSDTAYAASWDGVTDVAPSKNTVYDELYTRPRRNAIINGNMSVWQRGTSFTSATIPANRDDVYLMDRWTLLSDGNDIVDVSQVTTPVPVGAYSAACFDIETEDKKWGIIQILEAKDAASFIGGTVSLSFKARRGASDTSTKLRAAVLSWSSTADAVTSDVVNAWGDEGTNPTLVANWTFENVPAALTELTDDYQTFKIEGIAIDTASTTNIAVLIWSDDKTNAVGDLVYITGVQLELGSTATEFEYRPYQEEERLCTRYAWKLTADTLGVALNVNAATSSTLYFPTPMRATPSMSGQSFTVNTGNNGTPALYAPLSTNKAVYVYNSDGNWTVSAAVSLTALFTSEL